MTMTIKDKMVDLKYRFDYLRIYEDQYKGLGARRLLDFKTYAPTEKTSEDFKPM